MPLKPSPEQEVTGQEGLEAKSSEQPCPGDLPGGGRNGNKAREAGAFHGKGSMGGDEVGDRQNPIL